MKLAEILTFDVVVVLCVMGSLKNNLSREQNDGTEDSRVTTNTGMLFTTQFWDHWR